MEQGKTELFSGLQLDEQQCSWSPSKAFVTFRGLALYREKIV